jgi:chromosome segregation ATPase
MVAAKADRDNALAELSATQDRLGLAHKQIDQLSHEVTSLGSTNVSIEGQLQNARADLLDSQARLDACRADFALELEKIRLAAKQSEERIAGTEARALVEIDRERVNAAQSRKALEKALAERAAAEERNRDELLTIQKQLANQNHKNGIQEGELRAMTVNLEKSLTELDRLRVQLNEAGAKNSMLRAERNALEVIRPRPRKASRKLDSTAAEAPTQNTAKRSVRAK